MKLAPLFLSAALLLAAGSTALADDDGSYSKADWPLQKTQRPLVLAAGMLEIGGDTVRLNLSEGSALKPVSLAPDVFYGINKKLSVGITHATGVCLTGTDGGCAKAYNDLGLEALYSLMGRGSFQLAANAGLALPSLADPTVLGLRAGIITRVLAGKIAFVLSPSLYVGFTERDLMGDALSVPLEIQYQLNNQTALLLETGFAGALDGLADAYAIPVGLGGLFAINEKLDVGLAFRFGNLAGTDGGVEGRELIGRLAVRL